MERREIPVLIIGGGVTGLAAASFLSALGIDNLTIERHANTTSHPKARAINPRATEALRAIGLEDDMHRRRSAIADHVNLIHMHSLAGAEKMRMPRPGDSDVSRITPAGWSLIDQSSLEPLLLERLDPSHATVSFSTDWVSLTPTADGVDVLLRNVDTGDQTLVSARYVIAADGSRGRVRKYLGVEAQGAGTLEHMVSFFLRADLEPLVGDKELIAAYILNDQVQGTFLPLDGVDRWVFNVSYDPGQYPDSKAFDREWCVQRARAGIGDDSIEVDIDSEKLIPWEISARVADRMQVGRVFIAGDAAHVMPPTGAFGASSGILDAHNLCWKLAQVLDGCADESLLASYELERLPMARLVVEQSMVRFRFRQGGSREEFSKNLIDELGMCFGFCYPTGADGAPAGIVVEDPYQPSAVPGARAPHVLLRGVDGQDVSTVDLLSYGRFALFVDGEAAAAAAALPAEAGDWPLDVILVGAGQYADPKHAWRRVWQVPPAGAVLVRPDGFVAWRGTAAELTGAVSEVLGRILQPAHAGAAR